MAESSEVIKQRIKNGDLDHTPVPPKPKKRNIFFRLATYPWEVLKILLGIDKDSLAKKSPSTQQPYPEGPSIRDKYVVDTNHHVPNPYTYDPVAYDNLRIYLQGQDGRGDPPPPCNCDHDHGDR